MTTAYAPSRNGRTAEVESPYVGAMPFRESELTHPESADSEISPSDLKSQPLENPETDDELLKIFTQRTKDALDARYEFDEQAILSLAFEQGKQWHDWISDSRRLQCLFDENSDDRYWFITDNQIKPLVQLKIVQATQSRPDVYVAPVADDEDSIACAEEANDILAHYDHKFDRLNQTREFARHAFVIGNSYIKCGYDKTLTAAIPTGIDPRTGMPVGMELGKVGELFEEIVLWADMLIDPKAKGNIHNANWIIHEKIVAVQYVQDRYGDLAKNVDPEVYDGSYASVEARISAIANDSRMGSNKQNLNAVVLREMWEKPSTRFEDGRMCTATKNRVLRQIRWPYTNTEKYPFVELAHDKSIGSIRGSSGVFPAIPLQRAMNRILSSTTGRAVTDKLSIFIEKGAKIGADAWCHQKNYQKFYYTGTRPHIEMPQGVPEYHFGTFQLLKEEMKDIFGAHDVSSGALPENGATNLSGVAIQLIQQADQAKTAPFTSAIEQAMVELKEIELSLVEQYIVPQGIPRIIGMDSQGKSGRAKLKAMTFEKFKGGTYRVEVTPGSGLPKTPEAQQQQLDKWFTEGMLGDPKDPETCLIYFELSEGVRTTEIGQRVYELAKRAQANKPTPEQVAMKQQQADKQKLAMEHEQAVDMAEIDEAKQIKIIQAKGEVDVETKSALMGMDHQHDSTQQAFDHAHDIDKTEMDHGAPISASIAWKGSASGGAELEKEKFDLDEAKPDPIPKPATGGSNGSKAK